MKRAQANLKAHKSAIRAANGDTYAVKRVIRDGNGTSHVRYGRTFKGVNVVGGDFVIHNTRDGKFAGFSAGHHAPLTINTTPKVKDDAATAAARKAFEGTVAKAAEPKLLIDATGQSSRLTWETVVEGMRPDGQTPSRLHVFTDAVTGAVISSQDEIRSVAGTGKSQYSGTVNIDTTQSGNSFQLRDDARGGSTTCDMNNSTSGTCTVLTDADNAGRATGPPATVRPRPSTPTSVRRRPSTTSSRRSDGTGSSATGRASRAGSTMATTTSTPSGTAPR